jgi:hypothetical protein
MRRIAGTFTISCDGIGRYAEGVFDYGGGFEKREEVMSSNGIAGYKSTPVAPFINGTLIDDGSFSLSEIAKMENSTITLDLSNGKQVVLRGAFSTNDDGLKANTDAKITVKFIGQSLEEVPAI